MAKLQRKTPVAKSVDSIPLLPPFSEILSLQPFAGLPIVLPALRVSPPAKSKGTRGAPMKHKNSLAATYKLKNTQGVRFKFSFVLQILIAHIHHMFGLKGKSRYQKTRWLRLHKKDGTALVKWIKARVGTNAHLLDLKRSVSVATLKSWLSGDDAETDRDQLSELRTEVFRKFCILKLIDLENQYSSDFNVISEKDYGWKAIREYIMTIMWLELHMPPITDEEVVHIIHFVKQNN